MNKCSFYIALLLSLIACDQNRGKNNQIAKRDLPNLFPLYSENVADSFSVFVNLPNDYNSEQKANYPVVYLLDANLYFDVVASVLTKYSEVGLAPSVILVGIGYKNFPMMDSLRNRDYTYPTAIPEYEMSVSGGADKFLSFIDKELIPYIDNVYKTDTAKRVLMGHSLDGYFTAYTLLQDLRGKSNRFTSYIAASPSIHYNNYYLLSQFKALSSQQNRDKKIKAYITYGGQEDSESKTDPGVIKLSDLSNQLFKLLSDKQTDYVIYQGDIFSNLDHMDTQLPTFIKGLQWTLSN